MNRLKGLGKDVKKEELIIDKSNLEGLQESYLGKVKIIEAEQTESSKQTFGVRLIMETDEKEPRRVYQDLWIQKADGELILFNYRVLHQMCDILKVDIEELEVEVKGEGDEKREILIDFEEMEIILHLQHKWEKNTEKGSKTFGQFFCKHEIQSVFNEDKLTLAEIEEDIIKPQRYPKAEETVTKLNMSRTRPANDTSTPVGSPAKVQKNPSTGDDF